MTFCYEWPFSEWHVMMNGMNASEWDEWLSMNGQLVKTFHCFASLAQ